MPHFCVRCGAPIRQGVNFCTKCGRGVPAISSRIQHLAKRDSSASLGRQHSSRKSPGTAAIVALLAGLVFFWGIGHIYLGRVLKGIVLLLAGWVIEVLVVLAVDGSLVMAGSALIAAIALAAIGGFLFQTIDAYKLAQRYKG